MTSEMQNALVDLSASKFSKKNMLTKSIIAVSFVAIAGCSSGGGGGGGNGGGDDGGVITPEPNPNPPTTPNPPTNPDPTPEPDPKPDPSPNPSPNPGVGKYPEVVGAVIDSGFDPNTFNQSKVIKKINIDTLNDSLITKTDLNHGGKVSDVMINSIHNNYKSDTKLINVEVGDSPNQFQFDANYVAAGIGEAVRNGARVVNASMGNGLINIPSGQCYGCGSSSEKDAYENYKEIVHGNKGYGAVLVVSAGNNGKELSESSSKESYSSLSNKAIKDRTIIAGGSKDNGKDIAKNSNYPGSNKTFQEMFLTAPYNANVNGEIVSGTSFSAPAISASALSLYHKWPHMTSDEVAKRLLQTADRSSPLYARWNCGDGTENCGKYYMGQGELDLNEAFKPDGHLRVASGDTVDGKSQKLSETMLVTSSAYGDAIQKSGALDDIVAFDDLGRDYKVNLSSQVHQKESYKDKAISNMLRLQSATMRNVSNERKMKKDNLSFSFSEYSNGNVQASFGMDYGKANFYLTQKGNQSGKIEEGNPMSSLNLMSSSMSYSNDADIDAMNKFGMSYSFNDNVSIYSEYEKSSNTSLLSSNLDDNDKNRDEVSRYNIGSSMNFGNLALDFNIGYQDKGGETMMLNGNGVFGLSDDTELFSTTLVSSYNINNNFSAFGMMERMTGNGAKSDFIDVSGVDTMSFGAGVNWKKGNQRASFAVTLPPKVSNSYATVNVPVGRKLDGTVIKEQRTFDLSPSGRQKDIEFAYRVDSDKNEQFWQLNILHVQDPNHSADADSENSIMATWGREF